MARATIAKSVRITRELADDILAVINERNVLYLVHVQPKYRANDQNVMFELC